MLWQYDTEWGSSVNDIHCLPHSVFCFDTALAREYTIQQKEKVHSMEMTQIQLPTQLVGEIQQSIPRDKTIDIDTVSLFDKRRS